MCLCCVSVNGLLCGGPGLICCLHVCHPLLAFYAPGDCTTLVLLVFPQNLVSHGGLDLCSQCLAPYEISVLEDRGTAQ